MAGILIVDQIQNSSNTGQLTFDNSGNFTTGNLICNGTITGGTGLLNIGSGQIYKDTSGNVGIGTNSPSSKLHVYGGSIHQTNLTDGNDGIFLRNSANTIMGSIYGYGTSYFYLQSGSNQSSLRLAASNASAYIGFETGGTERMRLDSSGNLGLGVTPSGWGSTFKALQGGAGSLWSYSTSGLGFTANAYNNSGWKYVNNGYANSFETDTGKFVWYTAASGTAGNAISFTQAMTLDVSGRLLIGQTTSGAYSSQLEVKTAGALFTAIFYNGNGTGLQLWGTGNATATWNGADSATYIAKCTSTNRSIGAAGTINASGADYAEYMTKSGDFEIAKGDVCGIDANGLLTNVFSEAVSFVVKSTDPSYVGGDSWGVGFKDDPDGLEIERQKVDRIAFAGQVPVNVLGAKAGDYIIPVVDKKGIRGEAVDSPTFEQYQIAVGKVIAIESDGRARIIVKVA